MGDEATAQLYVCKDHVALRLTNTDDSTSGDILSLLDDLNVSDELPLLIVNGEEIERDTCVNAGPVNQHRDFDNRSAASERVIMALSRATLNQARWRLLSDAYEMSRLQRGVGWPDDC